MPIAANSFIRTANFDAARSGARLTGPRCCDVIDQIVFDQGVGTAIRGSFRTCRTDQFRRISGTGRTAGRLKLASAGVQPLQACLFLLPARRQSYVTFLPLLSVA